MPVDALLFISAVGAAIFGAAYIVFRPRRGDNRLVRYYDSRGRLFELAARFEERGASGHVGRPVGGAARALIVTVTDMHLLIRSRLGLGAMPPGLDVTIPVDKIRRVTHERKLGTRLDRVEFEAEDGESTVLWLGLKWPGDFEGALSQAIAGPLAR